MDIQEKAIYTKYFYLAPKNSRITKKQFHGLFQEYLKYPNRKAKLLKKLKEMTIKKGKLYKQNMMKSAKNNKSNKYNKKTRKTR